MRCCCTEDIYLFQLRWVVFRKTAGWIIVVRGKAKAVWGNSVQLKDIYLISVDNKHPNPTCYTRHDEAIKTSGTKPH